MRVLVTGGAGYIGSHAARTLLAAGHEVTVLDNLSRGHRDAVSPQARFVELDVRHTEALGSLLREGGIECVMHFAAYAYVGESVERPLVYYDNNVGGMLSLLQAVEGSRCRRLVFSSTCATYGEPAEVPIREETPQRPVNPYGASKLFCERMALDFAARTPDLGMAILRYFNVAGAHEDGTLGERHDPETHLIPIILQAALGRRAKVVVHGHDYPTPDGTCIRDYIHVQDLVEAHATVMKALSPGDVRIYNLGIGRGQSVDEVISTARKVLQRPFVVERGPRRPGDPAVLYADASKIGRELGWRAQRPDLTSSIASAWRWFLEH